MELIIDLDGTVEDNDLEKIKQVAMKRNSVMNTMMKTISGKRCWWTVQSLVTFIPVTEDNIRKELRRLHDHGLVKKGVAENVPAINAKKQDAITTILSSETNEKEEPKSPSRRKRRIYKFILDKITITDGSGNVYSSEYNGLKKDEISLIKSLSRSRVIKFLKSLYKEGEGTRKRLGDLKSNPDNKLFEKLNGTILSRKLKNMNGTVKYYYKWKGGEYEMKFRSGKFNKEAIEIEMNDGKIIVIGKNKNEDNNIR